MKINDGVYGEEEINEPILIELINSESIQRLKNISQFGLPEKYFHRPVFSRYEHSLGVLILLRRLNASLKEQIAGLLHDVSHTAFSHVIDWVVGDSLKGDYQDKILPKFIRNSDIPKILEKYNLDYEDVSDISSFSFLEQELPHLCADRIDYSLREMVFFESPEDISLILNSLKNYNSHIVFVSKKAAEIFAKAYMKCQRENWGGSESRARYHILSNILKKAIDRDIISLKDMEKTDTELISVLEKSGDNEIIGGLNLLRNGFEVRKSNSGKGIVLKNNKFRFIDPMVFFNNNLKMLSEFSEEYHSFLEGEKRNYNNFKKIEIIPLNNQRLKNGN